MAVRVSDTQPIDPATLPIRFYHSILMKATVPGMQYKNFMIYLLTHLLHHALRINIAGDLR